MDDRAETVLLALVRGWGLDGLTGIEPIAGNLVRPLLDVRREDTEAACRSLRLHPRVDETNADTGFLRNALRHEALPALARATDRDVIPTIARTAELLRSDARLLGELAANLAGSVVTPTDAGVRLDAATLRGLTVPMASRIVRRALADAGCTWTENGIEGILDLAAGRPGRRLELSDGVQARRDRTHVVVER
jgi:tRNA(Ile)-lysidine synthase